MDQPIEMEKNKIKEFSFLQIENGGVGPHMNKTIFIQEQVCSLTQISFQKSLP